MFGKAIQLGESKGKKLEPTTEGVSIVSLMYDC